MKKTEVKKYILNALKEKVSPHGFRGKGEGFERKIPDGSQRIGLALYDYNPEYSFSFVLSVRLDSVQQICNMFSGSPPEYHSMTISTITQLAYFTKSLKDKYTIFTEQDIDTTLQALIPVIDNKIIPFLDQQQDVQSWDLAVNTDDQIVLREESLKSDCILADSTNHPNRGMTAIILAHLSGNSRFDQIADSIVDNYQRYPHDVEKVERLVDHLRNLRS